MAKKVKLLTTSNQILTVNFETIKKSDNIMSRMYRLSLEEYFGAQLPPPEPIPGVSLVKFFQWMNYLETNQAFTEEVSKWELMPYDYASNSTHLEITHIAKSLDLYIYAVIAAQCPEDYRRFVSKF